jgi:beta-phosphoglucomutase-like phosphatase (HAD superfamily)
MSLISKKLKSIEFVIFDCDNILINSDTLIISVMLDMIEDHGKKLNLDKAIALFGGKSLEKCIPILEKICQTQFDESHLTKCLDAEMISGLEPALGVEKFINNLKVPYCLATKLTNDVLNRKLSLSGLTPYFKEHQITNNIADSYSNSVLQIAAINGFTPCQTLVIKDRPDDYQDMKKYGFIVAGICHLPSLENNNNILFYHDINELYEFVQIG